MARVTIDEPGRMNLLGLMLADVLQRNVDTEGGQRVLARLAGEFVIGAGEMQVALRVAPDGVTVSRQATNRPRAELHGTLDTLLGLALGHNPVAPVLLGRLRLRGNPLALWQLRSLLRTKPC
jgi:hypothetical protein